MFGKMFDIWYSEITECGCRKENRSKQSKRVTRTNTHRSYVRFMIPVMLVSDRPSVFPSVRSIRTSFARLYTVIYVIRSHTSFCSVRLNFPCTYCLAGCTSKSCLCVFYFKRFTPIIVGCFWVKNLFGCMQ